MAGIADGGEPGVRVEVPGGRGVLVGDQGEQVNQFIQTYVEHQVVQAASVPAAEPVVSGNVPQEPPAFRPRKDLEAALRLGRPGGPPVQDGHRHAWHQGSASGSGVCASPDQYRAGGWWHG